MKKLRFVIALFALLLILASCVGENGGGEASSTAPETEAPAAELKFSEGGKCEFYIVYSYDFDAEVKDIALNLSKQIKKYTGATPKITDDSIRDNPTGDTGVEHQYEILLGVTNREESARALEGMRSRDFSFTFDGDKIVIAGLTADAVNKASERFINYVLIKQGKDNIGNATIVLKEEDKFSYTYGKYTVGTCELLGAGLSEYAVVYDKDAVYSAERYARLFTHTLKKEAGYALELNTRSKLEREIIFGKADNVEARHGFTVRAEGTKLYVSAECMEGYRAAYEYLTGTLFKGEKVEIADGFTYSGVAEVADNPEIDQKAGEYRVIFNNIYGNFQDQHPIRTRNLMQAELHLEYLPDVIGTQETSPHTSAYISFMLANGYAKVDVKANNSNNHNYTPLLYLKDKFEVIDKGYHLFDDGAGDKSKSVTWAVFKDKATGDIFAVGSTHFYWKSDELGQSARLKDAQQISQLAKNITAKHDCAFVIGGDFNCRINSDPFYILNNEGYKNLQQLSPDTMNLTTHHSYSEFDDELGLYYTPVVPTNPYEKAIDHALVYNESKLVPKRFRVILHDYSFLSSDHCPVMVEFDVN